MKKSRIISRGKFYEEFIAKYRGSSYIEDLHYEEVQKTGKTDPDKLINAMMNFYSKYPNTDYIANMVKILFDAMQKGTASFSSEKEVLWQMIISYVKRYPTSPEMNKLYVCKGDNVNLRNSPGIDGKLVGKIPKDEILVQLEKSMDTSQIGDTRDYWYRIASLRGPKGWIFGKFLAPIDISKYKVAETEEKWSMEELFNEWSDSHTPGKWTHVENTDESGINFTVRSGKKIAMLSSTRGKSAGIYSRYNASRAFSILCRTRFTGGDSLTAIAYVMANGKTFYIKLMDEKIEVSGRTIPLHTAVWHDYLLKSNDGRFAKLQVDGEIVSGRIEPVKSPFFSTRGIYCLFSSKAELSKGEMEYIKIR